MTKKIRWGVLGAGGIADLRTIPGMMLCDNAELAAVMEINMEPAEKCRVKWNCKKAYDNEADLLADPEIDAVYICLPRIPARQAGYGRSGCRQAYSDRKALGHDLRRWAAGHLPFSPALRWKHPQRTPSMCKKSWRRPTAPTIPQKSSNFN